MHQLQIINRQAHIFLLQVVHTPRAIENQQQQSAVDTPHPPAVPPWLSYNNSEVLGINNGTTSTTDTLYGKPMLTWLHAHKTNVLLISGLAPLAIVDSVAIANIVMVAHIHTLEQEIESTFIIR